MTVKPHHPLQEAIARMLFGIEGVPPEVARRMVSQAARMAVEYAQKTEAERDRLREELRDSYKISVCYFPKKQEIEATWEDAEGTAVMVTFPVDAEIGERLAELVPCGAYYKATALQEDRDE